MIFRYFGYQTNIQWHQLVLMMLLIISNFHQRNNHYYSNRSGHEYVTYHLHKVKSKTAQLIPYVDIAIIGYSLQYLIYFIWNFVYVFIYGILLYFRYDKLMYEYWFTKMHRFGNHKVHAVCSRSDSDSFKTEISVEDSEVVYFTWAYMQGCLKCIIDPQAKQFIGALPI